MSGGKNNQSHEPFDDGDKYLQRYIPSNGERGRRGRREGEEVAEVKEVISRIQSSN